MKTRFLIIPVLLLLKTQGAAQVLEFSKHLSSTEVTSFAQSPDGYIWIGTTKGLNRFNGSTYTIFHASGDEGCLHNEQILDLCQDSAGNKLWIGTECGLSKYENGVFHQFNSTVYDPVFKIIEKDSSSILCLGRAGLLLMSKDSLSAEKRYYEDGLTGFISLQRSDDGNFECVFQRNDSTLLTTLSPDLQRISRVYLGPAKSFSRPPAHFTDRDGGKWTADAIRGYTYQPDGKPYRTLILSPEGQRISHLEFDHEGFLWLRIGSRFSCINPETGDIVFQDTDHRCTGLILTKKGELAVLLDYHQVVFYKPLEGHPHFLRRTENDFDIYSLHEDTSGNIWASGIAELVKINPLGQKTVVPVSTPFTYLMPCLGSDRTFLLGISDGILEMKDGASESVFGKGFKDITCLLRAGDGTFWMGTTNEGVIHYDELSGTEEHFGKTAGLIDTNIRSIIEDNEGNIWFSTINNLARYNVKNNSFTLLHDSQFNNQFYDLVASAKDSSGRLYFAGAGAITVIDPTGIRTDNRRIPLNLEFVSVRNRPVAIPEKALRLKHDENTVSFHFSGIDFERGSLLNYAWKLEDYESEWQFGSPSDWVSYSYLPSGKYTFRVKVRQQDGEWDKAELAYPFIVCPAPWFSPLAIVFYCLAGLLMAVLGIYALYQYQRQKSSLKAARQRDELQQLHIEFMTNLSHELRSPLSMIYAPAKELEKENLGGKKDQYVSLIARNAERLRLISEQLLSEKGDKRTTETLSVRHNDLVSLIQSTDNLFQFAAEEKKQSMDETLPESCLCWFDTEIVSKILGNLLSNAIKYTPEGGHISVTLTKEDTRILLSVSDDGPGIPEEKRDRIFDRYDRLDAEDSGVVGSGIGLHYSKKLAQEHRGELFYEAGVPTGSIFRLSIPADEQSFSDIIREDRKTQTFEPLLQPGTKKAQTVMIVEDSSEIRNFLSSFFQEKYNIILASHALEAEDLFKLLLPDLVISDIIMPDKSGFRFCADIKANRDWQHIPVVLLTARGDAASSVEGMKSGADAFIAKPFDPDYLKATVDSLLQNRQILQERIRSLTSKDIQESDKTEAAFLSDHDKAFLEKIHAFLDNNMEREITDVADIARELGMSYSTLYTRIKNLSGETPKSYVTSYRMNVARQLLLSGNWNVSEVADRVGSSSLVTFSREFKNYFGVPPSKVLKKSTPSK